MEIHIMKRYTKFILTIIGLSLMPGFGGCTQKNRKLETQPLPSSSQRDKRTMQEDRMVHNAEMMDMTLADIHFLPNRPELNSNGTQRLSHLAWTVKKYGGKIILDMEKPKSKLTTARIRTVRKYMMQYGLAKKEIKITVGLSEHKGMEAGEAIEIYKDTRFKPSDSKKGTKIGQSL